MKFKPPYAFVDIMYFSPDANKFVVSFVIVNDIKSDIYTGHDETTESLVDKSYLPNVKTWLFANSTSDRFKSYRRSDPAHVMHWRNREAPMTYEIHTKEKFAELLLMIT